MKRIYSLIALIILNISAIAQQLPFDNHYLINKYTLSPAFAGASKNIEAFLGIRQNWEGINGAPEKQAISINGPMSDRSNAGFGASFVHERTGNFSHFIGNLTYAFHIELSRDKQYVDVGLAAEVYKNQLEITDLKGQSEDPALMDNDVLKGTSFNAGFGAVYRMKNRDSEFNIGVYVPRLLETKVSYEGGSQYTTMRQFMVHGSYFMEIDRYIDVEPFVVGRMTLNSGLVYEANVRIRFDKRIWVAPGYRTGAFIINAGAALGNSIVMNYSYEFGMGGILGKSSGTHEIGLSFLIKRNYRQRGPSIFPDEQNAVVSRKQDEELEKISKQFEEQQKKAAQEIAALNKRIDSLQNAAPPPNPETPNEEKKDEWPRPFILKNIKFANNSDKIFSSSFPSLNKLAATLRRNPSMMIKITGHTDNVGSKQYNKRLSEKRAKAIATYLVTKRRIKENRIVTEGFGEDRPIASNDSEQGKAKNRRIEVSFKK